MVGVNGQCGSGEVFFDQKESLIAVRIGGPHYDFSGKEIVGWLEASIRGDVIRKAFGKDPSKLDNFRVSVTYGAEEQQIATATTKYMSSSDSVEIRAYGFHYSSPQIKMKLPGVTPAKAKRITCVKGKVTRKVTGTKCPAGFKKK